MHKRVFILVIILTSLFSLFVAGFIGAIFQVIVGILAVLVFFGDGKWNKLQPHRKMVFMYGVILLTLGVQFVGIRAVAYLVQNSSMGK